MAATYYTVCAKTTYDVIPFSLSPLKLKDIWRRISFSRLRLLESKYGVWEFWMKEALSWLFERWEYLLLEQVNSPTTKRLLTGCIMQRKRPGELLHFEELTGRVVEPDGIHISRFAGARIDDTHLYRFFFAIFDYVEKSGKDRVYAVMRRGLMRKINSMFPTEIFETIPGGHYEKGGHTFIPVVMHLGAFRRYAELLRAPLRENARFLPQPGSSRGMREALESPPE